MIPIADIDLIARNRFADVERLNGATGMSDIEGKTARGAASECGQRASFNGATGMSDPAGAGPRGSGEGDGNRPNTIVKAFRLR